MAEGQVGKQPDLTRFDPTRGCPAGWKLLGSRSPRITRGAGRGRGDRLVLDGRAGAHIILHFAIAPTGAEGHPMAPAGPRRSSPLSSSGVDVDNLPGRPAGRAK